jgi:histidine ammonia-lyase
MENIILSDNHNLNPITLDGNTLTLKDLMQAVYNLGTPIILNKDTKKRINQSRKWVEKVQKDGTPVVYGVNTGFGSKATVSIDKKNLRELQRNLIMSHSTGVGNPLSIEVVRAAMLMRINTFAKGFSGIRLKVVQTLMNMFKKNVIPYIPEQGSLGASGDLAPLSHLSLVLSRGVERDHEQDSGAAYIYQKDNDWILYSGKKAMAIAGIPRIVLEAKEGLALNNGTQISTAILATTLCNAKKLVKQADIALSMSLEALLGISSAFREEIHNLKPHPGQIKSAENIRRITFGSHLLDQQPEKVQDAYSLRCHPQVLAGVKDGLDYITKIIEIEMNATNDNPIILNNIPGDNKAISGGNFHAQPIAFASDFLSIILCEVGNIAERRIFRLSDKNLNYGLPSFLINNSGLESGLMLAQYTAAALVSENKSFTHPASIDSIPSCENQEDHVSMAPIAARKAKMILENTAKVIAIEFLFAAQALDLRIKQLKGNIKKDILQEMLGVGTYQAYQQIRKEIPFIEIDRPVYPHIEKILKIVNSGSILNSVETKIGELK